jgi:hypothetical protein
VDGGRLDGWIRGCMDEWVVACRQTHTWMDACTDLRVKGWTDGWMDRWAVGCLLSRCFL